MSAAGAAASPAEDIPSLEYEPLLFGLTHLASAAAAASDGATTGSGRRRGGGATAAAGGKGRKRKASRRDEDEDDDDESEESDYSHASDDSDAEAADDDGDGSDDDGDIAVDDTGGYMLDADMESGVAAAASSTRAWKRAGKVKEKDIDGVARPLFPIVQSVKRAAMHAGAQLHGTTRLHNSLSLAPPASAAALLR